MNETLFELTADQITVDYIDGYLKNSAPSSQSDVLRILRHFKATILQRDAERTRADALSAWKCERCAARFEYTVSLEEIEGVALCSSCMNIAVVSALADAAESRVAILKTQNAGLIHAAAECGAVRDRAIRERNAGRLELEARWVSVDKALPPLKETVLVIDADGRYQFATRDVWGDHDEWSDKPPETAWFDCGLVGGEISVRFWRPLPAKPICEVNDAA